MKAIYKDHIIVCPIQGPVSFSCISSFENTIECCEKSIIPVLQKNTSVLFNRPKQFPLKWHSHVSEKILTVLLITPFEPPQNILIKLSLGG